MLKNISNQIQFKQDQHCREHLQSTSTTAQQLKMMKNHFGQTENQICIGCRQQAETLNYTQNLPNTEDVIVPAIITKTLTNVNHDHDQ